MPSPFTATFTDGQQITVDGKTFEYVLAQNTFRNVTVGGGGGYDPVLSVLQSSGFAGASIPVTQISSLDFLVENPSVTVGGVNATVSVVDSENFSFVIPSGVSNGVQPLVINSGGISLTTSIEISSNYLFDNFNAPDNTDIAGRTPVEGLSTWVETFGNTRITNNRVAYVSSQVQSSTVFTSQAIIQYDIGIFDNYYIELDVQSLNTGQETRYVMFRGPSPINANISSLAVKIEGINNGNTASLSLWRMQAGDIQQIYGSAVSVTQVPGQAHTLRIEVVGDNIKVYWDGTLLLNRNPGLGVLNQSLLAISQTSPNQFTDNVVVSPISPVDRIAFELKAQGYMLNSTERTAISQFLEDTDTIRDAIAREYGFLGTTFNHHKVDWRNPGKNYLISGGTSVAHNASGATFTGNGYLDTGFIIPAVNSNNFAFGCYTQSPLGASNSAMGSARFGNGYALKSGNSSANLFNIQGIASGGTVGQGFLAGSRINSSTIHYSLGGSGSIITQNVAASNPSGYFDSSPSKIAIGNEYNNEGYSTRTGSLGISHAVIFNRGLTAAELQQYRDAVVALQIAIGR